MNLWFFYDTSFLEIYILYLVLQEALFLNFIANIGMEGIQYQIVKDYVV